MPHSVDMTCSIADIMLQDAHHQLSSSNNTLSIALRLSYASIIIRAVNGIADSIQKNRATFGSSVAYLCSQIGLPSWIVDLRHDSAHNELPSLVPLRLAAKTLLGFFMEKYWTVLEDLRIVWTEEGVKLLMECKSTSKALDRVQMDMLKEEKEAELEEDNHDDVDDEEKEKEKVNNVYGTNAYSIFAETKKKKVKPQSPKPIKAKPQKVMDGRTPRQCLNEFFKNIPMDMGLDMIVTYLVWGGIGDAPEGRGILIPGSPSTFPETMNSVRKIRERYSLIVVFVASKWPGFVHALLVNIVHLMLSLDVMSNTDAEDAGKKRKLYFLKYWVHYLLSNEFYCFLQWHDITWKGSRNIRQRPREKWSEDLLLHMESSAPLEVLRRARLPLNNICDRYISEGESDICKEMVALLNDILGKERVPGVFVKDASSKRRISNISKDEDANPSNGEAKTLGLEEMEGMLHDDDDDEQKEEEETTEREPKTMKTEAISPWTLCHSWEPCAIGTLPGFV